MLKSVDILKCVLVSEKTVQYEKANSVEAAYKVLEAIGLKDMAEEYFYLLCLDVKLNIAGIHQISKGGIESASLDLPSIFKRAYLNNSTRIILAHNHPSGDPQPSEADINSTLRILKAATILDITVLDHIIVSSTGEYVSLRNEGYM